jgi:hypothetical protein
LHQSRDAWDFEGLPPNGCPGQRLDLELPTPTTKKPVGHFWETPLRPKNSWRATEHVHQFMHMLQSTIEMTKIKQDVLHTNHSFLSPPFQHGHVDGVSALSVAAGRTILASATTAASRDTTRSFLHTSKNNGSIPTFSRALVSKNRASIDSAKD